jgi:hypothetical protein
MTFHTGYLDLNTSWDLAQHDQIVWNSAQGRLFENSFILDAHISWEIIHANLDRSRSAICRVVESDRLASRSNDQHCV